jgi:putative salt-induced outer membrane protein YdiY
VSLAACLGFPAFARPKTDVLVMKNGDRFTCQVKSLSAGVLKVELDYVDGTISVDWLKVARLESSISFLVQLQDGSIYSGKVITPEAISGTPVKIEIKTEEGESVLVEKAKVVNVNQLSDTFLKRWYGNATLGSSYAKGNSTTQYNLSGELGYRQARWGGLLDLNSNLTSSSGASASTRNQLDLSAYRLLSRTNYFVAGSAGFLQSSVQEIQSQTILAGTFGRFLKNTNRVHLILHGGPGWLRTLYNATSSEENRRQDVGVVLISTNLQAFVFKKSRFNITLTAVPALTESRRLYSKLNASYYLKVFGKIDWNLSFYGNWDTHPPTNFPSSDYGSSTGLSYTFGNK